MEAYCVTHKSKGHRYYVLADSPRHAIEVVTLRVGDAEGWKAWDAKAETPAYGLSEGVVLDGAGKPVARVES